MVDLFREADMYLPAMQVGRGHYGELSLEPAIPTVGDSYGVCGQGQPQIRQNGKDIHIPKPINSSTYTS